MRRSSVRRRRASTETAVLALALTTFACGDDPTRPSTEPDPTTSAPGTLGLMEITLTGVTSDGAMTASARSVMPGAATRASDGLQDVALYSLDQLEEGTQTGIQLEAIATASFTRGERGDDGQRYFSAMFAVRNASADGIAYTSAVNNVTLVAVASDATISETPVTRLRRFDGTDAPAALATEVRPTGAVSIDGTGALSVQTTDVFQAFIETEAADLALAAGLDNVFPYGFIVRNPARRFDRRLAANPAADQFDGVVTLAFRVPLAADPADDAYEISILMLAVSDTETRVTQSFEEQLTCVDDLEDRAEELRATTVTLLDGGMLYDPLPTRDVAQVRTAGTAAAPTAMLPDAVTASYPPAPPVIDLSDSTGVVPLIVEIVPSSRPTDDPLHIFIARYGYYNSASTVVTYPVGIDNFFVPGAAFRGQPTEFLPGLHAPAGGLFEERIDRRTTPVLNWSIGNYRYVSADVRDREALATPPPCGYRY